MLKKFVETPESEMDYRVYERSFSGRLTRARYKLLDRFCRMKTFHQNCGHEYDCCGCLSHQRLTFSYKHNLLTITLFQTFNL
jgi:hypothetical protein